MSFITKSLSNYLAKFTSDQYLRLPLPLLALKPCLSTVSNITGLVAFSTDKVICPFFVITFNLHRSITAFRFIVHIHLPCILRDTSHGTFYKLPSNLPRWSFFLPCGCGISLKSMETPLGTYRIFDTSPLTSQSTPLSPSF